jgi:hypothetical protein
MVREKRKEKRGKRKDKAAAGLLSLSSFVLPLSSERTK